MARIREGQVYVTADGRIYARVQFDDGTGRKRDIKRRAKNRTHAKEIIKQILNEISIGGANLIDGSKMAFSELCDKYEDAKLHEAKYVGDKKVSGLRSVKDSRRHVAILRAEFGRAFVRSITHNDIEQWKQRRLREPVRNGQQRSIASVNRELETLRAMFHFAHREGWILQNPFQRGTNLISKSHETKRDRILTTDEEEKLIAACHNHGTARRAHLRAIIIFALDTACRRGEMLQLKWEDVRLDQRVILIRAKTTKTLTARTVGITTRLFAELAAMRETATDEQVFKITDSFKHAWASACAEAGIDGLRFHDLRHTAITRMIQSNMPANLVMKISGHTQPITFARYVNPDADAAAEVAAALDQWQARAVVESDFVQ